MIYRWVRKIARFIVAIPLFIPMAMILILIFVVGYPMAFMIMFVTEDKILSPLGFIRLMWAS